MYGSYPFYYLPQKTLELNFSDFDQFYTYFEEHSNELPSAFDYAHSFTTVLCLERTANFDIALRSSWSMASNYSNDD